MLAATGVARVANHSAVGGIGALSALLFIVGAIAFARYRGKYGKYAALSSADTEYSMQGNEERSALLGHAEEVAYATFISYDA